MLVVATAACAANAPAADTLPVVTGGRVVAEADGSYRFGWPAIYFEGWFEGTAVSVSIETQTELFRLLVDDAERARLGPGQLSAIVQGLAPGRHVVRLEKLTESQDGESRFRGFRIVGRGSALAPQEKRHAIEFIGDSHSVGYGDTATKRECTRPEVHDTTDTQQAFGPIVARRLGADYRVNAFSGFGIVRNYAGGAPGDSMVLRYARAIPGQGQAASDKGWKPEWIVINLGTNDFSTKLHAGEKWADNAALRADYRATYAAFVRSLMATQPQARFVLMGADAFYGDVQQVAIALATPERVRTLHTPALELTACDWHPSLKDQQVMAEAVLKVIRKR
ncbi:MAG: lipase [Sphingomonas sp.]|nr:lipase [Sphingomonas sp.]